MSALAIVRVQKETFSAAEESAKLAREGADIGAVVTFTGLCRDEGGALAALEIEHYPGMAEEEINRVVAEALTRWPLEGVLVIHRYGLIKPGEPIVLVIAASAHRGEAFAAASFLMDFLKTQAPFWKKQHLVAADDASADWVSAKEQDDAAAEKWRR
ncbi:molybdenum cofactor biosynthesis protein MoaE [Methylocapsa polymorpha]|uniref:Molybdopterin synthase catalytic subunit n=1 Tax=Methylocapsa polymorpha TaxID=3080828 RepID=A0ABZ0HMV6_9HYPH|nr:molybdenum cofactor biosynthesis protein MoaE [Methylocapsa sp. RX1]